MAFVGTSQKCTACDKTVYLVDRLAADNRVYHKACFRCHHCRRTLKAPLRSALQENRQPRQELRRNSESREASRREREHILRLVRRNQRQMRGVREDSLPHREGLRQRRGLPQELLQVQLWRLHHQPLQLHCA